MAIKAYVLIDTQIGSSRNVSDTLKAMQGVETVDSVTGPYDVIAVVGASDLQQITDIVTNQIHSIDGIARTITCLSIGSR